MGRKAVGSTWLDPLLDASMRRVARRWPDPDTMAREWCAEIAALRAGRAWRRVAFAASIAWTPSPRPRHGDRPGWVAAALTGVALLGAGLFDAVHDVDYALGGAGPAGRITTDLAAIASAAAAMTWTGAAAAQRTRVSPRGVTIVLALAMYAFLLAGNHVAVMPFMGWADIAPAVLAWTVVTATTLASATSMTAAGHRRLGWTIGIIGAAVAGEVAAICGSLHAVASLHVSLAAAPYWFPAAMVAGGNVAVPGSTLATGLPLGNISAMVGPLLLCSAFLVPYAIRWVTTDLPETLVTREPPHVSLVRAIAAATVLVPVVLDHRTLPLYVQAPLALLTLAILRWDASSGRLRQARRWSLAAIGAAAVSVPIHDAINASGATIERIAANTEVFGFGFASAPAGQLAVALVLGVLAARWIAPPGPSAPPTPTA